MTIDSNLRDVFNPELPFGGKSVLMLGCNNQLPPVLDRRLYLQPDSNLKVKKANNQRRGYLIYMNFDKVIFLDENMRNDKEDEDYENFRTVLTDIKNCNIKKRTIELIKQRFACEL